MCLKKPTFALLYDFDKTLCTKDMQEYSFIPDVNMTPEAFWQAANTLAREQKMDGILAYMYVMIEQAHIARKRIRREDFVAMGQDLEFYPGVVEFFPRINRFAAEHGVVLEHYIISSGLREIIEGSSIFDCFREVFACEFLYDENEVARWPKNVVNYTTKTQFLFRINKGVLDLSNDRDLNRYTPEDARPVPFRNMLYIGDGFTDVPCMKLVRVGGGASIAVYPPGRRKNAEELLRAGRVDFVLPADYRPNGMLYETVCALLSKAIAVDALRRQSAGQLAGLEQELKA